MQSPTTFLRTEAGAVTVDYVVLTAAAAGMALATLFVLNDAAWQWFRMVEEESVEQGIVSGTWAAAMRDYQPYNPMLHSALIEDFGSLTDEELDTVEKFVNDYVETMTPFAENESDNGVLTDLNFAMGYAYMDRVRERPYEVGADLEEVGRIAVKMGWDDSVKDMFAAPDSPTSF